MSRAALFQQWHIMIERVLKAFPSAALVSTDGELLVSNVQTLADVGTLPVAAHTCQQYFQLKSQDAVIINDPYSGGTLLSSVNLVVGVSFDAVSSKAAAADALLVVRLPFKPRVSLGASVESEGVRIPPTPIVNQGVVNQQILEAISQHPLAPQNMKAGLERGIAMALFSARELAKLKGLTGQSLNRKMQKEWMDFAFERVQHVLHDLAQGSAKGEVALGTKSRLVLSLEVRDGKVAFNFAGSGAPERYALSDAATLGACAGALVAAMNQEVPINAGLLRSIEVVAPLGSVVHARYPAPVFMGFTDGTALVANLVLKLIGLIDRKLTLAQSGLGACSFDLEFDGGLQFYDDLEPGAPATRDKKGASALDLWRRTHLQRSIEMIEKMYPLQVRSVAVRSDSGGSGQFNGGDGQTKVLEVLAPAKLRWNLSRGVQKVEGANGGKAALGPDIELQAPGEALASLAEWGEQELKPGTQIVVQSAGGGGYGE